MSRSKNICLRFVEYGHLHNGEIVLLSAHCIPTDELHIQDLVNFDDPSVAGVYGRQLPLTYSDDGDIRDLLITFGQDRRVQVKDCFFHNANSAIRRDIWEKIPFDPSVTNIEDRIWAGEVIKAGYKLIYEPEAAVFHYHGIHQTQSPTRAASTVKVLRAMDEVQDDAGFPLHFSRKTAQLLSAAAPKTIPG